MHDDTILDSIADGVFTVDRNWRIMSFNSAAEFITGVSKKEAVGKPCYEVFRSDVCESDCVLRKTIATGKPIVNRAIHIMRSDGIKIPISVSTAILKDKNGKLLGGVETFRDLSTEIELRKELENRYRLGDLISKNHRMQQIFSVIKQVAPTDATVLIQGESGTGKELAARAIHNLSLRNKNPFVAVNCGALPENLLESELFGYKKGAFTDAFRDKEGRFDAAKGGTLFLDEIGDLPKSLQVKLLRVLQEKTYEPLGSSVSKKADVRIIAATNRILEQEVKDGNFREDLYYRINIVPIKLPPLRERREDIPLIADYFINHFNKIYKRDVQEISREVMNLLLKYNWPGNIRELENTIEYAFVLCDCHIIETDLLPSKIKKYNQPEADYSGIPLSLQEIERRAITAALHRNNFKKLATARELNIDKNTLRRKIKKYKIPTKL
ncbi:MAG: sigma 54-interacting transcriptional regulator [Spirochaetales bacterium]|nr:sigma 54-interacting transcriptional regulator [Spirochaetales bacterium]